MTFKELNDMTSLIPDLEERVYKLENKENKEKINKYEENKKMYSKYALLIIIIYTLISTILILGGMIGC